MPNKLFDSVDHPAVVRGLAPPPGGEDGTSGTGPRPGSEPVARRPPSELPSVSAVPAGTRPTRTKLRILIVEDNKDSAHSLSLLLELLGHEVRIAYDGPAGVALATDWRPPVVICDIGLPGFDGYEVARRLRRDPALRTALLIALTGYGQERDRQMSRAAGFDHHLVKPAEPATIQGLLATAPG